MKPEEALRHIKTLIDGSDYLTDPRAILTLIECIRVLVEKGLKPGGRLRSTAKRSDTCRTRLVSSLSEKISCVASTFNHNVLTHMPRLTPPILASKCALL
jgi:hypothetical protein